MIQKEEIQEAAKRLAETKRTPEAQAQCLYDFEFAAEWTINKFEGNRLAVCDRQTPEEAEREKQFVINFMKEHSRTPTFSDCIEITRKQTIDKACGWISENIGYDDCDGKMEWVVPFADETEMIEDFKKHMEE